MHGQPNIKTHLQVVRSPLHGPEVNQMNPVHIAISYPCKLNFLHCIRLYT